MDKKHLYLDISKGGIEQYCMTVPKSSVEKWKGEGWLEYQDIGFPEEDLDAWMLYGEISKSETLIFNIPRFYNEFREDELLNLKVTGYEQYLGTYGMGGPGYFGLALENDFYLVYSADSASEFIMVNDEKLKFEESDKIILDGLINFRIIDIGTISEGLSITLKRGEECSNLIFLTEAEIEGKIIPALKDGNFYDHIFLAHKDSTIIV